MTVTLKPNNRLAGFGDGAKSLESFDKTLAYFAIKDGEPVIYCHGVLSIDEFATVQQHWRQYCESHKGHTGNRSRNLG